MMTNTVLVSRFRTAGYWISTGIIALAFGSGGVAYLAGGEEQLRGMAELGYPAYFVTILGVWKVLGALAIVTPRFPRLREWAYAGIAFDLIGAAASHAAVGHLGGESGRAAGRPGHHGRVVEAGGQRTRSTASEKILRLRVQTARA